MLYGTAAPVSPCQDVSLASMIRKSRFIVQPPFSSEMWPVVSQSRSHLFVLSRESPGPSGQADPFKAAIRRILDVEVLANKKERPVGAVEPRVALSEYRGSYRIADQAGVRGELTHDLAGQKSQLG